MIFNIGWLDILLGLFVGSIVFFIITYFGFFEKMVYYIK
jgi:hypothetical protein